MPPGVSAAVPPGAYGSAVSSSPRPIAPGLPPSRSLRFRSWVQRHRPAIALVVLAITIPELLTGSTPVVKLVDPFAVAGLLGFYGAGSLLIRETSIRWKKGWAGILVLGLAYGIAEEGIATKTIVDPKLVGYLGYYGHFLGVNWVDAAVIVLFHALFSIALPILLVELIYPTTKGQRFLTDRGTYWALGLFALTVSVGYVGFDSHFFEGYGVLAFLLLVGGMLILAARWVPASWFHPSTPRPTLSPAGFLGLGAVYSFGWLFFYLIAPRLVSFPVVCVVAQLALALLVLHRVVRRAGSADNELIKVYFAMGLLSWYIPWDLIVTLLGDYPVYAVLILVYLLLFRLRKKYRRSAPGPAPRGA